MANSWITFVKAYAAKNDMKYNEAMKDPKLKVEYNKSKDTSKGKKGKGKDKEITTKKGDMKKTTKKV